MIIKNSIDWFAIFAVNFDRTSKFYGEAHLSDGDSEKTRMLPNFNIREVRGGNIYVDPEKVASSGIMVYINGELNLNQILDKLEQAGSKIILPQTTSPEWFMATFLDSEGNKLAIHNS